MPVKKASKQDRLNHNPPNYDTLSLSWDILFSNNFYWSYLYNAEETADKWWSISTDDHERSIAIRERKQQRNNNGRADD